VFNRPLSLWPSRNLYRQSLQRANQVRPVTGPLRTNVFPSRNTSWQGLVWISHRAMLKRWRSTSKLQSQTDDIRPSTSSPEFLTPLEDEEPWELLNIFPGDQNSLSQQIVKYCAKTRWVQWQTSRQAHVFMIYSLVRGTPDNLEVQRSQNKDLYTKLP
jgi:hypothetical protein